MFTKAGQSGVNPGPEPQRGYSPSPIITPPPSSLPPTPSRASLLDIAPVEMPRVDERAPSVLGADLKIRGGIEGRGEIQLQGRAWGDVKVERLIVGEAAQLEGSVIANTVEVRGRVVGSIAARSVRLLASARVEGDITYEQLQIELGAQFEGRCIRGKCQIEQSVVEEPAEAIDAPADDLDMPEPAEAEPETAVEA